MRRREFIPAAAVTPLLASAAPNTPAEWRVYGGDANASRYSPAARINKSNVKRLKVAWSHRTGDSQERPATAIECTPILVEGVMYLTSPMLKVHAVNPGTGERKWAWDPFNGRNPGRSPGNSRGVTYFQQGKDKRIFTAVQDRVYSIDAVTGELDQQFGEKGSIDLKKELDHEMTGLNFRHSSPVVVFEDLVIVGGGGGEGPYPEAPGHIRAYDARTGKRRWIFHTVPKPGEFGHDSWAGDSWRTTGGTNCWAGMSLDARRGIVYAGIGSPSFDFWGGNRTGANLFGNCVLALNARTGARVWHFQTVHHDVWDMDHPSQPMLITIRRGGKPQDVVVQLCKTGYCFVLDRASGKPVYGVEEKPIPDGGMDDDPLIRTQPRPLKPPPLSRQGFRREDITDISPEAHAHVLKIVESSAMGDLFTPNRKEGYLIHPGFRGGPLWGGGAFDPVRNKLFVGSDEWTNRVAMRDAQPGEAFKYGLTDRADVRDHEGYPGIKPPWGYMTAIDMNTGDFAWRVVNGEFPELKKRGIKKTGAPSHGGAICTAGGLVIKAGTFDKMIRAFDSDTGATLWETELPSGGFATPMTYEAGGKQYIVIAAGGGKDGSKSHDEYVAFSL